MAEEVTNAVEWEGRHRRLLDLLEPLALTSLYVYSVVSGVCGLVLGIVATAQCTREDNKRVGKICLLLGLVHFALIACLVVAYILLVFLAFGGAYLFTPGGG